MKKSCLLSAVYVCALIITTPIVVQADVIDFHFTGQFTAVDPNGNVFDAQTPISSALSYDTVTGIGNSTALFVAPFSFLGLDTAFHDISMER
ncbi:MAG: hypothetical protein WBO37_16655, partial [Gammaproteobacteria bacterium]